MPEALNIWHPCTQMKDHETWPVTPIDRGEGIYIIDREGNRYIDAISSWWVNLFGHANPRIGRALCEQYKQLEQVIFAGCTHAPAEELARRLRPLMPRELEHLFLADNGSSAVEAAMKMSYGYWNNTGRPEKRKFAFLAHGYHGETLGALSVCGEDFFRELYSPIMVDNVRVEGPDCYRCPYGLHRDSCDAECFAPMEKVLGEQKDQLSGVLIEPMVQCAGGFKIYSPRYLEKLRAATQQAEVHLILDEIAVGFGRTGTMLASEHAGITGDLVCLSKGITSGTLPLSAVLATDDIYQAFYADWQERKAFLDSHSFTGNALACAVAVETLKIFEEENVLEANKAKWTHLQAGVRERFADHPHVGEVRGLGFICALELVKDPAKKEPFDWRKRTGLKVFHQARKRGVWLRNLGDVIYFMPPYVITSEEITTMVDASFEALKEALS